MCILCVGGECLGYVVSGEVVCFGCVDVGCDGGVEGVEIECYVKGCGV